MQRDGELEAAAGHLPLVIKEYAVEAAGRLGCIKVVVVELEKGRITYIAGSSLGAKSRKMRRGVLMRIETRDH